MKIEELLAEVLRQKASDIHLKVENSPILRINGRLKPLEGFGKCSVDGLTSLADSIMDDVHKQRFKEKYEIDLAYSVSGVGRFRVNIFRQRGTISIVMRTIPVDVPTIQQLNLPQVIEKLAMETRGLILVTGTTSSGKSTTLAAMIDYINTNREDHIITIEDPIEFLHRDKKSIVNQREIGLDTESFSIALRSALRQDPDVILVGEMRDFETIQTALVAAETGHLVLSTLHTTDATETINRIIAVFPPFQQKQIRIQLASVLKGVISMRLVSRADDRGRIPAVEVLVVTSTAKEYIIDPEKTKLIHDVIAAGTSQYGMQTFEQALLKLYQDNLITYEEALRQSTNPDDFALRAKGITSTADATWNV